MAIGDTAATDELRALAHWHARSFVEDGTRWSVWPSTIENVDECRPPKMITDLGPPRLFFYSRNGDFFAMPYSNASWSDLAAIPESELRAWLRRLISN